MKAGGAPPGPAYGGTSYRYYLELRRCLGRDRAKDMTQEAWSEMMLTGRRIIIDNLMQEAAARLVAGADQPEPQGDHW